MLHIDNAFRRKPIAERKVNDYRTVRDLSFVSARLEIKVTQRHWMYEQMRLQDRIEASISCGFRSEVAFNYCRKVTGNRCFSF